MSDDRRRAWSAFLRAYKIVVEAVDKGVRLEAPISLAEYELLLHVKRAGDRIRFIDLANLTLLSQSRISRQIDTLQEKGFLYREITDTDRRATFAVLTKAGQKAFDEAGEAFVTACRDNFLDLIPEDRLGAFAEVLEMLIRDPNYRNRHHRDAANRASGR